MSEILDLVLRVVLALLHLTEALLRMLAPFGICRDVRGFVKSNAPVGTFERESRLSEAVALPPNAAPVGCGLMFELLKRIGCGSEATMVPVLVAVYPINRKP